MYKELDIQNIKAFTSEDQIDGITVSTTLMSSVNKSFYFPIQSEFVRALPRFLQKLVSSGRIRNSVANAGKT